MVSPNDTADVTPCAGRHPRSTEALIAEALRRGIVAGALMAGGAEEEIAEFIPTSVAGHAGILLALTEPCGASREDARKVRVYYDDDGARIDRMEKALRELLDWAAVPGELHQLVARSRTALKGVPAGEDVLLCGSGVRALEAAITMTYEEPHDDRCD